MIRTHPRALDDDEHDADNYESLEEDGDDNTGGTQEAGDRGQAGTSGYERLVFPWRSVVLNQSAVV